MPTANILDHDILRAAIRRMEDRRPFTPRPHTDIEYYAPCLKANPPSVQRGDQRKLTTAQAKEIIVHYRAGKASQRKLADMYGVSQPVISDIVNGVSYREASAS